MFALFTWIHCLWAALNSVRHMLVSPKIKVLLLQPFEHLALVVINYSLCTTWRTIYSFSPWILIWSLHILWELLLREEFSGQFKLTFNKSYCEICGILTNRSCLQILWGQSWTVALACFNWRRLWKPPTKNLKGVSPCLALAVFFIAFGIHSRFDKHSYERFYLCCAI